MACLSHVLGLFFERDILKSREGMHWNRVDRMLCDPRPDTYETTQVHGAHTHANARGVEVVHHLFRDRRKPRVGCEVASLKAITIASLSQELLGLLRIVRNRFGLQGEVHHPWDNDPGWRTKPEARC